MWSFLNSCWMQSWYWTVAFCWRGQLSIQCSRSSTSSPQIQEYSSGVSLVMSFPPDGSWSMSILTPRRDVIWGWNGGNQIGESSSHSTSLHFHGLGYFISLSPVYPFQKILPTLSLSWEAVRPPTICGTLMGGRSSWMRRWMEVGGLGWIWCWRSEWGSISQPRYQSGRYGGRSSSSKG